jgi:hypothetical protein
MELDLQSLVGKPIEEARAIVTAAGCATRTIAPGDIVTADFRPDRVTLIVEDGRVAQTPVRG